MRRGDGEGERGELDGVSHVSLRADVANGLDRRGGIRDIVALVRNAH